MGPHKQRLEIVAVSMLLLDCLVMNGIFKKHD